MGKFSEESLFGAEIEALQTAMADIADERYSGNELLPRYNALVAHYQRLLKTTKKIFYISDSQGHILQRHQSEIQNLLDNADQGFLTFGQDLRVDRQYSAECTRIFGRKLAGISIVELLGQDSNISKETLRELLVRTFSSPQQSGQPALQQVPPVFRIGNKDIRIECKLISQPEDGVERTLVMMILTDITERLRAEEQIRFLSYHDKLTGLHNRAHIEAVLPELEKPGALPLSMIMADVNGLKLVNDVFGHQQGDMLLVALATVLKKSCRQTDIIARWGGDEFLIILPRTGKEECSKICEQIQNNCNETADCAIPLSVATGTATKEAGAVYLTEMFCVAENRMYNDKLIKSREVRKNIAASLAAMLQNRCFESAGHGERVKQLAFNFASFLGLDMEGPELQPLNQLVALHDMGKVAISTEILGKAGPLTPDEWEVMKSHSEIGYRMAQSIGEPAVADIILALHERWDGEGYPCRLKGDQIPLLARIFSLVDVYDVVTHERPYEAAMDKELALREIESGSGTQFDPELAKCFIRFMTCKK